MAEFGYKRMLSIVMYIQLSTVVDCNFSRKRHWALQTLLSMCNFSEEIDNAGPACLLHIFFVYFLHSLSVCRFHSERFLFSSSPSLLKTYFSTQYAPKFALLL
jgi:hypothetical protein